MPQPALTDMSILAVAAMIALVVVIAYAISVLIWHLKKVVDSAMPDPPEPAMWNAARRGRRQ